MADLLLKKLDINRNESKDMVSKFLRDMDLSLQNEPCCLNMLNSFVAHLPTGKEKGKFMAIDIGGTNLRVQAFKCDGDCTLLASQKYVISDEIKNSDRNTLFDYLAECTEQFIQSNNITLDEDQEVIPLGFTFSYPVEHLGLKSGLLLRWTKEMNVDGVVGGDVAKMMEDALKKKNLKIRLDAMVNDTIGTLVSLAFKDQNTSIGIINGTGSNFCYMDYKREILYNVEFGAYGSGAGRCLDPFLTEVDFLIDKESLNPGKQIIEKTISGKYLGEVFRQVLVKLVLYERLLKGWSGKKESGDTVDRSLYSQHAVSTDMMAEIESEIGKSTDKTRKVMASLGIEGVSEGDLKTIQLACSLVSSRAAKFFAAGLSAAIIKIDRPKITIAYDGSVVKSYPGFKELLLKEINENLPTKVEVCLKESEDGSGRGAALVAASNPCLCV